MLNNDLDFFLLKVTKPTEKYKDLLIREYCIVYHVGMNVKYSIKENHNTDFVRVRENIVVS